MAHWTPQELLHTGQVVRYEVLRDLLVDYGFELREGNGSSHVPYHHTTYPEILGVLIRTTDNLGSQRTAARQCQEVQRRQAALENSADTSAEDPLQSDIVLPEDILVERADDQLILRSRDYPVIGRTVLLNDKEGAIAEIVNHTSPALREDAKQFATLITQAESECEIRIGKHADGSMTIVDPYYPDNVEKIPVYAPSQEMTAAAKLQSAIKFVQGNDERLNVFYEDLEKSRTGRAGSATIKNGRSTLPLTVMNPMTEEEKRISLPITPQGRVANPDFVNFVSEYYDHLFHPKAFRALEARFGIQTKGLDNSELRFTHPVLGLEINTANPRQILKSMDLPDVFARAGNLDNSTAREELLSSEIIPWAQKITSVWSEMEAFARLAHERTLETIERMRPTWLFLGEHLQKKNIFYQADRGATRFGKLFDSKYGFTGDPRGCITFTSMLIQPDTTAPEFMVTLLSERDMERVEKFAEHVREKFEPKPSFSLAAICAQQPPDRLSFDDAMNSFGLFR